MSSRQLSSNTLALKFMQRGNAAAAKQAQAIKEAKKENAGDDLDMEVEEVKAEAVDQQQASSSSSYAAFPVMIAGKIVKGVHMSHTGVCQSGRRSYGRNKNLETDEKKPKSASNKGKQKESDSSEESDAEIQVLSKTTASTNLTKSKQTKDSATSKNNKGQQTKAFQKPKGFEEVQPHQSKRKSAKSSTEAMQIDDGFVDDFIDGARAKRVKAVQ